MGIESGFRDVAASRAKRSSSEETATAPLPRVSKRSEVPASSRPSKPDPLERELARARADGRWDDADKIARAIESRAVVIDLAARRRVTA